MKLTTYQISEAFEFGAYARGKQYYKSGAVKSFTILSESQQKMQLIARVYGADSEEYQQSIIIKQINFVTTFNGDCSCKVGKNCKHVVAACFQLEFDLNNKPKDLVGDWLNEMAKESEIKPMSNTANEEEYFITYRLFERSYGSNIEAYKSRILKNGNLSSGITLYIDRLNYSYFNIMTEHDKGAVDLLENMKDINSHYSIKNEIGYMFMARVIKTQHCFYASNKSPLTWSQDKVKLTARWNKVGYNNSQLAISINGSLDFKLITTLPILAIDKVNNTVHELENDLSFDAIKKLAEAPKIPDDQIIKVYQALSVHYNSVELPVPDNYKVTTIVEEPVPLLHIYQDSNDKRVAYLLNIEFVYGEQVIGYLPLLSYVSEFHSTGQIKVMRDNTFEEKVLSQLTEFGFQSQELNKQHFMHIPIEDSPQVSLQQWNEFLKTHVDELKSQGWRVEFNENFKLEFDNEFVIEVESEESNDWFSLSFNIRFGDRSYPLAPLVSSVLNEYDSVDELPNKLYVECGHSQYIELKTKEINPVLKTLFELFDRKQDDNTLKLGAYDAHMLDDLDSVVTWKGSQEILKLSRKLKNFKGIKKVKPPTCLKLELRDYQQLGLNWLNFLYEFKFSGILADDMGLGKTVQTLSHLSRLKQDKKLQKPALIIVPTSLIANWKNEVNKFTPNLNIITLYGNDRHELFKDIEKYDLILTTYTLVGNDFEWHQKRKHSYVILDEAQKIKNPKTKMAKTICQLKSENRLALTGTPIENHLGELWSIFNFLMPGFLHNQKLFNEHYRKPIEIDFNNQMQEQLNKRIKPFIMRRTKGDVLTELPPKTEIIKLTQFDQKQSKLYETIRITMNKKVREAVAEKGLNKSHIHILDALLKLRQVCCDPSILKLKEAKKVKESAKLDLFLDLLDELMLEGRKVLVFSQFTTMLSILEREIKKKEIKYVKLTGSSIKRDKIIEKFTDGQADVFLISLKAGGVGLNLVEADTVIHYDPWWNPAVENQATDRAHRIGQNKKVFVYKLIVENTIEQKIIELQKKKKALQDGIFGKQGKLEDKKFSGADLMDLLKG